MEQLSALDKRDRRQDRQQVETLLAQERGLRTTALAEATGIQKEEAHWVDVKRHLPEEVRQMEQNYGVIKGFDLGLVTAAAQKAETDWPDKARNLEKRLAELRDGIAQSESAWQSSGEARRLAAANDFAHLDLRALVAADNTLKTAAGDLPAEVTKLEKHSAQLYNSWDKILVDMADRGGNQYDQKIRTVQTHFADASAKTGDVTSEEKWVHVSEADYEAEKSNLGMAIEHKPAGMYESEAEHVAQPAGFAYVAPPTQGSNQYGYWDHRDGRDFWVFYGQYALMRDLLWNHQYRPFDRYEWENYRTYSSRGQTYYGQDGSSNNPKYGTQGSVTQNRYSSSTYAKSGGFRDSRYASKSGSYRSSQYASPSVRDPNADHSPKTFGHSSPSQPPPRTVHPAPPPRLRGRHPEPPDEASENTISKM